MCDVWAWLGVQLRTAEVHKSMIVFMKGILSIWVYYEIEDG